MDRFFAVSGQLSELVRDLLDGACAHRIEEWTTEMSGGSVVMRLKG